MNKDTIKLVDECTAKITKLAEEQDELFAKLVSDVGNTDESFVDAMFDYCYNGGEYTKRFFKKLVDKAQED